MEAAAAWGQCGHGEEGQHEQGGQCERGWQRERGRSSTVLGPLFEAATAHPPPADGKLHTVLL